VNNPETGTRESSGVSQRSYLFLSMILLVWNTAATGSFLLRNGFPPAPIDGGAVRASSPAPPQAASLDNTISPNKAPLTIKQKYLIGKRVDINKALKEEINALPGISDAMADAIVAERDRIGGFRSPKDLMRVKGIKEKRLKKILPYLEKMENN